MNSSDNRGSPKGFPLLGKPPIVEATFQMNFVLKSPLTDSTAQAFVQSHFPDFKYKETIYSESVEFKIQAADRDLQKTQTFGLRNRILCILRTELQRKYGIDGWNGYGAKAVAAKSVENAEAFVKVMPFELRDPVVRVIPTGCVSFVWRQGKWRFCSVVFDTDGSTGFFPQRPNWPMRLNVAEQERIYEDAPQRRNWQSALPMQKGRLK